MEKIKQHTYEMETIFEAPGKHADEILSGLEYGKIWTSQIRSCDTCTGDFFMGLLRDQDRLEIEHMNSEHFLEFLLHHYNNRIILTKRC